MKRVRHLCSICFFVILPLGFIAGCVSYLSEENSPCPCSQGWKCCDGRCIEDDKTCDKDGGDDGDGDSEDGKSGDQVNSEPCTCRNSEDMIDDPDQVNICVRKDYTCNALNLCENGYECNRFNECQCMDNEICPIDCSTGCDCPAFSVCDTRTTTCRPEQMCADDRMCLDGKVCREDREHPPNYYICAEPIGGGVGASCDRSYECLSRMCYSGVCLKFCTGNQDCPTGQLCSLMEIGTMGCVLQTECGPSCNADDEYCEENHEHICKDAFCRTDSDCLGNCGIEFHAPLVGQCITPGQPEPALNCTSDEFVSFMGAIGGSGYCIKYQACWDDADCQAPYSCVNSDELGDPMIGEPSLCARKVGR